MVHREFLAPPRAASSVGQPTATFEKDWKAFLSAGEVMGDTAAGVKILEFADLECPYCREFHKNLRQVLSADPKGVVGYYVHYPNAGHRFALPAARAAECARTGGRFGQFVDVVFAKQDSLGLKSWGSYAMEAGLHDTTAILTCARLNQDLPRVSDGISLGRRLNVHGTPTVLFNGWRIEGTASIEEINRIVGLLKRGKPPFAKQDSPEP